MRNPKVNPLFFLTSVRLIVQEALAPWREIYNRRRIKEL